MHGLQATFKETMYLVHNSTKGTVVAVEGVVHSKIVNLRTLGWSSNPTDSYQCEGTCAVSMGWSVTLLLVNMLLSLMFMGFNLLEYIQMAKYILLEQEALRQEAEKEIETKKEAEHYVAKQRSIVRR